MRVKPPSTTENNGFSSAPNPREPLHPLAGLALALALAITAGLLAGWDAATTVLACVLGFFRPDSPSR